MDYQGIGMLAVIVAFLAIFIGVLVSRSKASSSGQIAPEVADIKVE
jgi:hypothetical protein